MTDERHKLDIFTRSLSLLDVDDDGLTDSCDFDDIKAIAQICPEIKKSPRPAKHPNSSHYTDSPH